jgi:hypothetical protein
LAREALPLAQKALVECLQSADPKIKIAAIKETYDRYYGKPIQAVSVEDGEGNRVPIGVLVLPAER